MEVDCVTCKGKYYSRPLKCGHSYCPIYTKVSLFQSKKVEKQHFLGTAPGVFVGRYGYPKVNVGILSPPEIVKDAELYESPHEWGKRKFAIEDVLRFRGPLINSRFENHVKTKNRYLEMSQEVAMSSKAVDMEFFLTKKPNYTMKHDTIETPMGARAPLRKALFQGNVKVDRKVDYIVSDTDLKAGDAISTLYKKGYDETFLNRLLSIGNLGVKGRRKLVPTRWSITATDDTVGKSMLNEVKKFKEADYQFYYGGYLGNYFMVLFFPRVWSYELFEMYLPSTLLNPGKDMKWTTDYELFSGRKKYVDETAGGYYASRLGVLEQMKRIKRQAAVVVLRFTSEEYHTHLGVWVVREAVRRAMKNPILCSSEKEMLDNARMIIAQRFRYNIDINLKQSKVLKNIRTQKSIREFLKV